MGFETGEGHVRPFIHDRHYAMHYEDVYALTPKGEQELRSSATTISLPEVELLVRFNGVLTRPRFGWA